MIRLNCPICGNVVEAANDDVAQGVKCRRCSAQLVAPSDPTTRTDGEAQEKQQRRLVPEEDDKPDSSWLIDISFSEAALFAMTFAFLVLYAVEQQVRRDLYTVFRRVSAGSAFLAATSIILIVLPFLFGLALSIFHAFSKRQKSFFEKATMLFFAVAASAGTGLYAGWHILKTSSGPWFMIFAVWNLAYGVLLLIEFEAITLTDRLDDNYVSDWDATFGQIVFGTVTVLAVLLCCHYLFRLHWAITYSICATYATGMDKAVQKVFGVR